MRSARLLLTLGLILLTALPAPAQTAPRTFSRAAGTLSGFAQTCTVTLEGVRTVSPTAPQIMLSSARMTDTNTITGPNKVVPIRAAITGLGRTFLRTFAPYSLTVLKLSVK